MGSKTIEADKKDNKLQIPKSDIKEENIKDKDKLKVEIKSNNNKLYLKAYLNVTSGGQISITKYGMIEVKKHYELYPDDEVVCLYNKEDFETNFADYYEKFKELAKLHKKLRFGYSPRLPEGFTENLCRYLYGLYEVKGREYDAIDNIGYNVEIKATTSETGTVTINSDIEFDYLLWMYFNLEKEDNELCIYKLKYDLLKEKLSSSSGRVTISLNSFINDNNLDKVFKINKDSIEEIKNK